MLEVRSQTLGAGVELETQVPNWAVFFFFFPTPFNGWQSLREKDRLELGWQGDKVPAHTHLESVFFCRGGQVCRRVFPFQGCLVSQVFFPSIRCRKKRFAEWGRVFWVVVRTFSELFGIWFSLSFCGFRLPHASGVSLEGFWDRFHRWDIVERRFAMRWVFCRLVRAFCAAVGSLIYLFLSYLFWFSVVL